MMTIIQLSSTDLDYIKFVIYYIKIPQCRHVCTCWNV